MSVKGHERVDSVKFIKESLSKVYKEADSHYLELSSLIDMVENHVAWITWDEIYNIIELNKPKISINDRSFEQSTKRLCDMILDAIRRHS